MSSEGILLVDKPAGITSHGVIARLRRMTGIKKIGHAGTLDPFATGLLICLVGRTYTKKSAEYMLGTKTYRARLRLGIATDSHDLEGKVILTSDAAPTHQELCAAIAPQNGERLQTPPMVSAKKVGGKKLYELARKGITIERVPSPITLETTLLNYSYPHAEIEVTCSKGTYIRVIAHEIGEHLGCGAHLTELRRTHSGTFCVEDAHTLESLETSWEQALLP